MVGLTAMVLKVNLIPSAAPAKAAAVKPVKLPSPFVATTPVSCRAVAVTPVSVPTTRPAVVVLPVEPAAAVPPKARARPPEVSAARASTMPLLAASALASKSDRVDVSMPIVPIVAPPLASRAKDETTVLLAE
ncbi:hypothetical protein ASG62_19895 [Aureimonas sp. Leaf427]|nr:hypothetical protein ASG62_19895 [Aureimonas sp. Leaf427]